MRFKHYMRFAFILFIHTFHAVAQPVNGLFKATLVTSELIFSKAPFKQCHASSLIELSNGHIMTVWFGGTHERHPDVCIWGAVRDAKGWRTPTLLADGIINDSLRYPCWNPVLFKSKKGELLLFYKVGPSPSEWWGMCKKSPDDGRTWFKPLQLAAGILGPVKNKPIYVDGRIIGPSSTEDGDTWHAHMELSDDDGNTWSKIPLDTTTGYKLIQPTLLSLQDGIILALMRSDQSFIVESRSSDKGTTWSKPAKTNIKNPNSGIDAVTLKNGLHVLVYNPANAGKEWFEGRSKLFVMVSADGEHWQDAYKLEDNTSGEYSYPAVIQSTDGLVHITYTSNRASIRHVVLQIDK